MDDRAPAGLALRPLRASVGKADRELMEARDPLGDRAQNTQRKPTPEAGRLANERRFIGQFWPKPPEFAHFVVRYAAVTAAAHPFRHSA